MKPNGMKLVHIDFGDTISNLIDIAIGIMLGNGFIIRMIFNKMNFNYVNLTLFF